MKIETMIGWAMAALLAGCCQLCEKPGVKVSSYGYDPVDSTRFLQQALDSGEKKIIIDKQSGPWYTLPLKARSNMEIIVEPGVELVAKRGAYHNLRDYLFEIADATNVTIRGGAGATFRMWKKDYQGPDYSHGEWRYALRIIRSENIYVEGLNLVESGGDGIGVSGKNITIRNCVCDKNHRQGISLFTGENILIENVVMSNTEGTAPQAGIDIEPDRPSEKLINVVLRNCKSINNAGSGYELYLNQLDDTGDKISVRFENCVSIGNNRGANVLAGSSRENHFKKGLVAFDKCTFLSPRAQGVYVVSPKECFDVAFTDCVISNAAGADVCVTASSLKQGMPDGLTFKNLTIWQSKDRKWFSFGKAMGSAPENVQGDVTIHKADGKVERCALDAAWVKKNMPVVNGGKPIPEKVTALPKVSDVVVNDLKIGEMVNLQPFTLLYGARLIFFVQKPGTVKFAGRQVIAVKGRAPSKDDYVISLLDAAGKATKTWKKKPFGVTETEITFEAPKAGFYTLETKSRGTRFYVSKSSHPVAINLTKKEHVTAAMGRKSFSVWFNAAAKPFALIAGGSDYYQFKATLKDPAGNVVKSLDPIDTIECFTNAGHEVPGLWQMEVAPGKEEHYDWVTFDLYGTGAYLFLTPEKTWK